MAKKVKELEVPKTEVKGKAKPALEKVTVVAKQIGKNLNVVVGNEKFTRMGSKEELQVVKDAIKAYDEKPTKSNMSAMMQALRPVTTEKAKVEEKVKADIKATKKKVEAKEKEVKSKKTVIADVVKEIDDKLMTDEELKQMEQAIDRQKAKKQATATTTNTIPRGREW